MKSPLLKLTLILGAALALLAPCKVSAQLVDLETSVDIDDFLTAANYAAMRTKMGVAPGTNVQAYDADLNSLAAAAGTNTIYYRSAPDTWSAVTIGNNLTFASGTLAVNSAPSFTTLSASGAVTFTGTTAITLPYGSFTDASNFRRPAIGQSSGGILTISSAGLGTGATGNTIILGTNGSTCLTVNNASTAGANGVGTLVVSGGLSTSQGIFVSGSVTANQYIAGSTSLQDLFIKIGGSGTGQIRAGNIDGGLTLQNNAGTDWTRLMFGGTTSAFPTLIKSGTVAGFRQADNTIATFANLPAAAAGNEGCIVPISDSTTNVWGATITGGGANHVLAYSNGSAWTVIAK